MKNILKTAVFVLIFSILVTNTAIAVSQPKLSDKKLDNYKIAYEVYQNYLKGINTTEFYVKEPPDDKLHTVINLLFGRSFETWATVDDQYYVTDDNYEKLKISLGWIPTSYEYLENKLNNTTNEYSKKSIQQEIDLYFKYAKPNEETELNKVIDDIAEQANRFTTTREKLEFVNKYITDKCEYSFDSTSISPSYGCLIEGKTTCGGYASAAHLICLKLNIPIITVYGTATNNEGTLPHAWNAVYVDNKWLYWDPTWCDSGVQGAPNLQYFLKEELFENHKLEIDSETIYDYYKTIQCPTSTKIDLTNISIKMSEAEVAAYQESTKDDSNKSELIKDTSPANTTTPPKTGGNKDDGMIIIGSDGKIIETPKETTKPASTSKTASPMNSKVKIDGKNVAFEVYSIDGSSYFKLRDIAMAIKGSTKKFNVTWDGKKNAINILTKTAYQVAGGELAISKNPKAKTAQLSTSTIYVNGKAAKLTVYTIDGSSYFKLRDLGKAVNFNVTWDGKTNTIGIDTKSSYKE